jgi:hypothetical protein
MFVTRVHLVDGWFLHMTPPHLLVWLQSSRVCPEEERDDHRWLGRLRLLRIGVPREDLGSYLLSNSLAHGVRMRLEIL